jgi:hypothetical protein
MVVPALLRAVVYQISVFVSTVFALDIARVHVAPDCVILVILFVVVVLPEITAISVLPFCGVLPKVTLKDVVALVPVFPVADCKRVCALVSVLNIINEISRPSLHLNCFRVIIQYLVGSIFNKTIAECSKKSVVNNQEIFIKVIDLKLADVVFTIIITNIKCFL